MFYHIIFRYLQNENYLQNFQVIYQYNLTLFPNIIEILYILLWKNQEKLFLIYLH